MGTDGFNSVRSFFRFSLRSLVLLSLTAGALFSLWYRKDPWVLIWTRPEKPVNIKFSERGDIISDPTVGLWSADDGQCILRHQHAISTDSGRGTLVLIPDGQNARLVDANTGETICSYENSPIDLRDRLSPEDEGRVLVVSENAIRLFQPGQPAPAVWIAPATGRIGHFQHSAKGRRVLFFCHIWGARTSKSPEQDLLYLLDTETVTPIPLEVPAGFCPWEVRLSPSGRHLALAVQGQGTPKVAILDAQSGKFVSSLPADPTMREKLRLGTSVELNGSAPQVTDYLVVPWRPIIPAFSNSDRFLVTAAPSDFYAVWNVNGERITPLYNLMQSWKSTNAVFAPGDRWILDMEMGFIWDSETGYPISEHSGRLHCSSNDRILSTGGGRGTISVRLLKQNVEMTDAEPWTELLSLESRHAPSSADLSPAGQHLVISMPDGISMWEKRRPEGSGGWTKLPEFWLSILLLAALAYSSRKDQQATKV